MALSADKIRDFGEGIPALWNTLQVAAATTIYVGSAVSVDSNGRVRPLNSSDEFAGFCEQRVVNTVAAGYGSAGELEARIRSKGEVTLVVTGVSALTHVHDAVYATDDDTFTTNSSGALQIGKVKRIIDASIGLCVVSFEGLGERSV